MTDVTNTVAADAASTPASAPAKAPRKPRKAPAKAPAKTKAKAPAMTAKQRKLAELRTKYADGATAEYGAGIKYAAQLTAAFGQGWEKVALAGPISENMIGLRKAIIHEKDALYAILKLRGHKNPSVKWSQIKAYAAGPKPKGAKGNEARPIIDRQKDELTKLFKAFFRTETGHTPVAAKINATIGGLLQAHFKVNLGDLKK